MEKATGNTIEIERCYELLELEPGASVEEAKQAYRDVVDVWHPDRFTHNQRLQKKAEEKFKEMNRAYETLISHINSAEVLAKEKKHPERFYEQKRERVLNKNSSGIEEFAEAGTFLVLQAWSHLLSIFDKFSKR